MSLDKVVNFLYDTWGGPLTENIEAMSKVIDAWEQGLTVYYPDGSAWKGIAPPSTNTPRGGYAAPVPAAPDWTCGCGTTLHGDEAVCWRCGAHAQRP